MINRFRPCFEIHLCMSMRYPRVRQFTFIPFTHILYTYSFYVVIGLCLVMQTHPQIACLKMFVFLGSELCLGLPPAHTSRRIPCLQLVVGNYRPPQWTLSLIH